MKIFDLCSALNTERAVSRLSGANAHCSAMCLVRFDRMTRAACIKIINRGKTF